MAAEALLAVVLLDHDLAVDHAKLPGQALAWVGRLAEVDVAELL